MTVAVFTIPVPPSLNNAFFNRPRKGRTKTTEYKNWLEAAAWEIRSQRVPVIAGEVKVSLLIRRPNKSSDLDNRLKGCLDAMQKAGVIENDNRVVELFARWTNEGKGCQVTVYSASEEASRIPIKNARAA